MKMIRFLLSAVMLVALLAGMQLTAYATLESSIDEESIPAVQDSQLNTVEHRDEVSPGAQEDAVSLPESSQMPTVADIYPISANPDTGAESLAIPAVVALLAASTAAIALTSKKKK